MQLWNLSLLYKVHGASKKKTKRSLEENNSRKGWDENHWEAAGVLNSPSGGLFKVSKASSAADTNAKWEWTAGRKEPSMHFLFCFLWITSETRCRCSLACNGCYRNSNKIGADLIGMKQAEKVSQQMWLLTTCAFKSMQKCFLRHHEHFLRSKLRMWDSLTQKCY